VFTAPRAELSVALREIPQGSVEFTHDETHMARGEPCTTVRLYEPGRGRLEETASFHCIPRKSACAAAAHGAAWAERIGYGCVLTDYQFPGDDEAHGVPSLSANVHW